MTAPVRWRFPEPGIQAEEAQRAQMRRAIEAWWTNFSARAADISALFSQSEEWDLAAWMEEHLGAIDPRLMWEYGPAVKGEGHRLVITPESDRFLRPLVEEILRSAPVISGWEFYPYRLAEDVESARLTVQGRTNQPLADAEVRVAQGELGRIDLTYISGRGAEVTNDVAFVATETLLGEQILDEWIGVIEVGAAQKTWWGGRSKEKLTPISELKSEVEAAIERYRATLPEKPWHERVDTSSWSLLELKPDSSDDYPAQQDLLVAKTPDLELWKAAHQPGSMFFDARFSRCNETFAFVKLDGREGLDQEKFQDKSEIEDALEEVLRPKNLGCFIGGGTGRIYSYLDFALTDVPRSIEVIRARLRQGNVPKRSWIQFYNSALAAEWIGIYEDSPPPPLPDFE